MPGYSHSTELISCTTVSTCFDKDAFHGSINTYWLTTNMTKMFVLQLDCFGLNIQGLWRKKKKARNAVILFKPLLFSFCNITKLTQWQDRNMLLDKPPENYKVSRKIVLYVILFNIKIRKHKGVDINFMRNAVHG